MDATSTSNGFGKADVTSNQESVEKTVEACPSKENESSDHHPPEMATANSDLAEMADSFQDVSDVHEREIINKRLESEQARSMECVDCTEDQNQSSDRFLISVKPAGLLFESNFVNVVCDDEEIAFASDHILQDPIAQEPSYEKIDSGQSKVVETILAVSDEETFSQQDCESEQIEIVAAGSSEPLECLVCHVNAGPTHLVRKGPQFHGLCSENCLAELKGTQAKKARGHTGQPEPPMAEEDRLAYIDNLLQEFDMDDDSFRRCSKCTRFIRMDDYLTWQAQDFCNEGCLCEFQRDISPKCAQCSQLVPRHLSGKYCVRFGLTVRQFCKTACLISYKKTSKLCLFCQEEIIENTSLFCSERCKASGTSTMAMSPKPTGCCSVCHQVKEVELKVLHHAKVESICSERCFVAYKFVNKIELVKCEMCPTSFEHAPGYPSVHTSEGAHYLCSQECQKLFLIASRVIVHCVICRVKKYNFDMIQYNEKAQATCVCSLHCLSLYLESIYSKNVKAQEPDLGRLESLSKEYDFTYKGSKVHDLIEAHLNAGKMAIRRIFVAKPRLVNRQKNKAVMCKPRTSSKGIQCRAKERAIDVQTDDQDTRWIPIPVPIYVPFPLHLFVQPVPVLTPIPIPLIVPIFILTGRKSMKGVQKEIQKIKSRIPADPLEAEILMMADMAAGVKRSDNSSDSDADAHETSKMLDSSITSAMDSASTSFSDDVLSMAFKMANDYTEPLDLESEVDNSSRMLGKRAAPMYKNRGRAPRMLELVKPDENLALKFSLGVNAWKQWATIKNHDLQKMKSSKFVKLDLLQLSAEDLCFCLCQFVKEVRKPNGAQYASDTIYYLCLGIQLYLYENGRIDNLFCDPYYEKFTDAFNDICLAFCQLYAESQYIVTRVEEEHLWESKQLGAHSPLVLLNTLLFFNTKHFNLTTVDDHLQLSFSHIMKHWKRNANAPSQRNVLLRFYPPQKSAWGRRKVYEQQECLENPLRCPVRLYEFFLSKCPESVKTRNDVFYLQPERSCVPDSPVWYSTMALDQKQLEKMLNRMKMIKEISMAILGT